MTDVEINILNILFAFWFNWCTKSLIFYHMAAHDIGHYIPKVKAAIEFILRSCHRTYSQALLTSSRTAIGNSPFTNLSNDIN